MVALGDDSTPPEAEAVPARPVSSQGRRGGATAPSVPQSAAPNHGYAEPPEDLIIIDLIVPCSPSLQSA